GKNGAFPFVPQGVETFTGCGLPYVGIGVEVPGREVASVRAERGREGDVLSGLFRIRLEFDDIAGHRVPQPHHMLIVYGHGVDACGTTRVGSALGTRRSSDGYATRVRERLADGPARSRVQKLDGVVRGPGQERPAVRADRQGHDARLARRPARPIKG